MSTALTTTTEPTRTQPPATWAGLRASLIRTHRVATDAHGARDLQSASFDLGALCAQALEALALARPEEEASRLPGVGRPAPKDGGRGSDGELESDLVALVSGTLTLAVAVLDNLDEPLSCAEVMAISRTVTALCTARAALAGALR